MKKTVFFAVAAGLLSTAAYATINDPVTELGIAGPGNWAVLDQGNFSLSDPLGFVHGNVGEATGNFTDGGSAGVSMGKIFLGAGVGSTTVAGDVVVQPSSLPASALAQASAAATYYNTFNGSAMTTAPGPGTVTPGVYHLSSWTINGGTYNLTAGQLYVFNIDGNLSMNTGASPLFINDSTPQDVIFNVGGNVTSSGGSSTWPMIQGAIINAQGSISLTPGFVQGEIISQTSINIASRGAVQGLPAPDGGSTLLLTGLGVGLLGLARKKLLV